VEGTTLVILVASLLLLNFVVVPLIGLRVASSRRRIAEARGLHTEGYASILLSRMVVQTSRVLPVEWACLLASGKDPERWVPVAAHGLDADVIGRRIVVDASLQSALCHRTPQRVDASRLLSGVGRRTAIAAPVWTTSGRLALCVATADDAPPLDRRELGLLSALATLCAAAVEDLVMKDRLDSELRSRADELARFFEHRNRALARSSVDVVSLASQLGKRLGLDAGALIELDIAARVFPAGSAQLPLSKRASVARVRHDPKLEPRFNPAAAAIWLARTPGLEVVALIVRFIGERWDGNGLERLPGSQIPLASRILATCDALRVLTASGPHTVETALRDLQSASGTVYDPTVVGALSQELLGSVPELGQEPGTGDWAREDLQFASLS
jgi:hypothetical protein